MKKMTNDLKWRLKELPTAEGIAKLVETKVITAAEAREILLKSDKEEDKDVKIKQLQERVYFLEDIVSNLSKSAPTTIYYPRWIETKPWFTPTQLPGITYVSSTHSTAFALNSNMSADVGGALFKTTNE